MDGNAGGVEVEEGGGQVGAVAGEGFGEGEFVAGAHHGHSVAGDVAGQEDGVAGGDVLGGGRRVDDEFAEAGGVDVEAGRVAGAFDGFGVAGEDGDADGRGFGSHGLDDAAEGFQGEAFFEDEAGREGQGTGAGDEEVVDGARHGEFADVSAGEFDGADDVGIGGQDQAGWGGGAGHGGGVAEGRGGGAEGGEEDAADEVAGQGAAAAVREGDGVVAGGGGWEGAGGGGHGLCISVRGHAETGRFHAVRQEKPFRGVAGANRRECAEQPGGLSSPRTSPPRGPSAARARTAPGLPPPGRPSRVPRCPGKTNTPTASRAPAGPKSP